ncbi:MAG: class I SAM-dependent methyltransferase [Sneathiellaceae bacterium]
MPPLFTPVVYDFDKDPRQRELMAQALNLLHQAYGSSTNEPGAHLFMGDNLIVIQHQFSFFEDAGLLAAIDAFIDHSPHMQEGHRPGLRNRIWRFYTLGSLARNCLGLPGIFAEFGVYIGESAFVLNHWLRLAEAGKRYCLFDVFDPRGLISDAYLGPFHGPALARQVTDLFAGQPQVQVLPGRLPDRLAAVEGESFAFAHIDLNHGPTELAVASRVYDRMPPGGVIVFDDYGWGGYGETRRALDAHFGAQGRSITELPTGQGLLVRS